MKSGRTSRALRTGAGTLAVAAAILACAAPAAAQDELGAPPTPKWFSVEIGAGAVQMTGTDVKQVYGKRDQPLFHMRAGVLVKSILDVGVGGDFAQITGKRVGAASGGTSAEPTRLTLGPLSATALVRLDFFHNQPVVPYGGGGIAYMIWGERDRLADRNVSGDKYGWIATGGVMILLDQFEPARAADFDSWWGVNDTFLTVEVSRTEYDRLGKGPTGLDLNHWSGRASFLFEF